MYVDFHTLSNVFCQGIGHMVKAIVNPCTTMRKAGSLDFRMVCGALLINANGLRMESSQRRPIHSPLWIALYLDCSFTSPQLEVDRVGPGLCA